MGIKNIKQLLHILPNTYKQIKPISDYKGKTIVIDAPMFAHINIIHPDGYKKSTIDLLIYLLSFQIKLIFVFDGEKPQEKHYETCIRRREKKNKLDYYRELEEDLQIFKRRKHLSQKLLLLQKKLKTDFSPKSIQEFINKGKQKISIVNENDYILFQHILTLFNIPFLIAKGEGETLCSFLVKKGLADAVLSRDSDVLASGTPITLFDFNFTKHTFTEIKMNKLLLTLQLDYLSWLDCCILCGTDFNIPLTNLSVENVYELIKTYKRISKIPIECSDLDFHLIHSYDLDKIRNLFVLPKQDHITKIPIQLTSDFETIAMYIVEQQLDISLISLKKILLKSNSILT